MYICIYTQVTYAQPSTHTLNLVIPSPILSPAVDLPYIGCDVCEITLEQLWNQSAVLREKEGDGRVRELIILYIHVYVGGWVDYIDIHVYVYVHVGGWV